MKFVGQLNRCLPVRVARARFARHLPLKIGLLARGRGTETDYKALLNAKQGHGGIRRACVTHIGHSPLSASIINYCVGSTRLCFRINKSIVVSQSANELAFILDTFSCSSSRCARIVSPGVSVKCNLGANKGLLWDEGFGKSFTASRKMPDS